MKFFHILKCADESLVGRRGLSIVKDAGLRGVYLALVVKGLKKQEIPVDFGRANIQDFRGYWLFLSWDRPLKFAARTGSGPHSLL